MHTPTSDIAIDRVIQKNLKALRRPGAILVRPGFKITGGRVTDTRAIVVTVNRKLRSVKDRDRLPTELRGYAVDVREATGLQRLRKADPARHAVAASAVREQHQEPTWPLERSLPDGKLLASRPAPTHPVLRAAAGKAQIRYTPAPVPLAAVTRPMTIIACASPDAGFTVLADFLTATKRSLTVGIYDFTSSELLATLDRTLRSGRRSFRMTICHPPKDRTANQTDEQTVKSIRRADPTAKMTWALVRNDPFAAKWIYPSAYHIKVAVRDSSAFWLSSGNWNVSNQPDLKANKPSAGTLAGSDRDWHVIVADDGLARTFEAYLQHDLAVASANQLTVAAAAKAAKHTEAIKKATDAHAAQQKKGSPAGGSPRGPSVVPFTLGKAQTFTDTITLQPVLTPDKGMHGTMYVDHVLDLLNSARQSLYVQMAYIHPSYVPADRDFKALLDAIGAAIKRRVDVRIINGEFENTPQYLELMHEAGLAGVLRLQKNVHNKGIVVDSRAVLVSSQNWSPQGVLQNRDAGVIIHHAAIARYFEANFLQDWEHRARPAT